MRNNSFTKKLAGVLVFTFVISTAFCLDVDEVEIKSTQNQTIVFENYTGPHKVVDSLEAIKGIGDSLGNNLEKEKSSTRGNPDKYYIIHCYDQN